VLPDTNPVVQSVISGDIAEKVGLKAGDIVLAVNGERMTTGTQLTEAISRNGGKEIELTLRRNGRVIIRGTYLESHSDGTNRIKGGQVQIN